MSISSFFSGKTVAILGGQLMTGTLLLHRLLLHTPADKILLFLKTKNNSFSSQSLPLESHKLFSLLGINKELLLSKVQTVRFIQNQDTIITQSQVPPIDVIFNCYTPVELENKALYRHILFPKKIVKYVTEKNGKALLVVLSSIYSQDSGYVPEDNYISKVQLPASNNPKAVEVYLNNLKLAPSELWKYTVKAYQHIYFNNPLNVVLIRLPTIGATIKICEGYIDKFTSLSWIMYQVGLGQIRQIKGNSENIIDIIPGDYVVNFMLVSSATKKNKKEVCNLSTSTRNPLQLKYFIEILNDYWRTHKMNNTAKNTHDVKLYEKSLPYTLVRLKDRLPHFLIAKFANSLDLKGLKIKTAKKIKQLDHQQHIVNRFQGFLRQQWICQSNKSIDIFQHLTPQQKSLFNFNLNQIIWKHYIRLNAYSIQYHLLGLEVEPYSADTIYVINKGKQYFDDIYWSLTHGKQLKLKPHMEMKRDVINSANVKKVMLRMIEEKTSKLEKSTANYAQVEKEVYAVADAICERMFAKIDMKALRFFVWFMHKVFKQIYEQVVVDRNAIRELKSYEQKHEIPLIIIPTHRSYLDFLVFPYLFFGQNIKTPMIGAADDFLNMALIHILFRKSGAFFITRNQKQNRDLYLSILNQYCTQILTQNNHFKFFIEGTRSRLGKMMEPKLGLLNVVCDTVLTGKINDALIVPVTINYEKVLEGASFPYELLGEAKVKESLGRLIKAVNVLKENYGQIHIEICRPISIKQYFNRRNNKSQKEIVNELGYEIVHTMTDNLVITPTSLVSTIILMQRKGISEDEVKRLINILSKDIHGKGIKIIRTQHNSTVSITSALQLMGDIVTKTKKNIFEVGLSADTQGLNILSLCYYRNTLSHIYFLEAIVLVALSSFGYEASRESGVSLESLKMRSAFLVELIKKQYVLKDNLKDANVFSKILDTLAKREMISVHGLTIVANSNSELVDIVCSIVWPLVESYWMTLLYLFKLHKQSLSVQYSVLLTQIQWFGETMINERFIEYYQAISQDTIKNALSTYSKMGLIQIVKQELKNKETAQFVKLSTTQNVLKDLETKASLYLKSHFARTVKGKLQDSSKRSSVALDFPFLAKL